MPTAFSRSVKVFIDQNLAPAAQSAFLANTARKGVAELIATKRAPPRYDRFVDGREGASEDSVKPDGNITYVFEYLNDVIEFSIDYLMKRAPEKTGNYKKNFFLSVDGRQPLNA